MIRSGTELNRLGEFSFSLEFPFNSEIDAMAQTDSLVHELPSLRRFARALCGTQKQGDELVSATLQQISENPQVLREGSSIRVQLFKAFNELWTRTIGGDFLVEQLTLIEQGGVDQSLAAITPLPRQAFLLTALERFDESQVGEILGVNADEVGDLLAQARQEIADQTATSVLIIEDELFIATQLEDIVQGLGHVVLGMARTRSEAQQAIERLKANLLTPGLVLADIQLADGSSGIDAVKDILSSVTVPVVFITAFPERLLTGKSVEPTYLLSKPFTADSVRAIVTQALFFRGKVSV